MSDNLKHHVLTYKKVFFALLVLTVVTVGVSYVEFKLLWVGILVGLIIASLKGYLVAANFMHLNNEKKLIYGVLVLTVFFFLILLALPIMWEKNSMDVKSNPKTVFEYKKVDKNHKGSDH